MTTNDWSSKQPADMTLDELAQASQAVTSAYDAARQKLDRLGAIQNHVRTQVALRNGFTIPGLPSPSNLPEYPLAEAQTLFGSE